MSHPTRTVVTVNSSGRQAASFVRVASAVGWHVRAQMRDRISIVAQELCTLANVTIIEGELHAPGIIQQLFFGSPNEAANPPTIHLAFLNTTHWGDEVALGRALADAARKAGVRHVVYSGMPDHSVFDTGGPDRWEALPLWEPKMAVENYIRQIGLPATFVYCGIYHNNFTSLPYPLFRLELFEEDGEQRFEWKAPFHPDKKLPWLDAEHDVGPVVLQIFKEGPGKWAGKRIPLAFESLTPNEVTTIFSRALQRPCTYTRAPISIEIGIPTGYREHLAALERVLGRAEAPYFGPELEPESTTWAPRLWQGNRGLEEYAREVFPLEERANGLAWMVEGEGRPVRVEWKGSC